MYFFFFLLAASASFRFPALIALPFYLFTYLYLFKRNLLLPILLVFGFLFDLQLVFNFGTSSLYFLGYILSLELYNKKYNQINQKFLLIILIFGTSGWFVLTTQQFDPWQLFFFSISYLLLTLEIRDKRQELLKIIK